MYLSRGCVEGEEGVGGVLCVRRAPLPRFRACMVGWHWFSALAFKCCVCCVSAMGIV